MYTLKEREQIQNLIKYAEKYPLSLEYLQSQTSPLDSEGFTTSNPDSVAVGRKYTIEFANGINVTYTQEQQPTTMCRHLSVSSVASKYPPVAAVNELLVEFGFINQTVKTAVVWGEHLDDYFVAVNVLEPLDGDMSKLRKH